jgi:hypothetical protein
MSRARARAVLRPVHLLCLFTSSFEIGSLDLPIWIGLGEQGAGSDGGRMEAAEDLTGACALLAHGPPQLHDVLGRALALPSDGAAASRSLLVQCARRSLCAPGRSTPVDAVRKVHDWVAGLLSRPGAGSELRT